MPTKKLSHSYPTLILVRHLQAEPYHAHGDFERRIVLQAESEFYEKCLHYEAELARLNKIIASSAMRTVETQKIIRDHCESENTVEIFEPRLYNSSLQDYLEVLGEQDFVGALALIGHNPAISHLFQWLTGVEFYMQVSDIAILSPKPGTSSDIWLSESGQWEKRNPIPSK